MEQAFCEVDPSFGFFEIPREHLHSAQTEVGLRQIKGGAVSTIFVDTNSPIEIVLGLFDVATSSLEIPKIAQ